MNEGQSGAAPGNLHSNHHASSDDVTKFNGDVTGRDNLSENTASLISQATDIEFEHDTADYQWLLDYEWVNGRDWNDLYITFHLFLKLVELWESNIETFASQTSS